MAVMFVENLRITSQACLQIGLLGFCGWVLVKRGVLDTVGLGQLSNLVVKVFFPALVVSHMVPGFRFEEHPWWWAFPLMSAAVMSAGYGLGRAALWLRPGSPAPREFLALTSFQNSGNIPLLMAMALFSGRMREEVFIDIFLFTIGFNLLIWTVGAALLRERPGTRWEWLNPPFLATVFSLLVVAAGLSQRIPETVMTPVARLGDCALPVSMLVLGGNLAAVRAVDIDRGGVALYVLVKLVLLPAAALAAVLVLRPPPAVGYLAVIEAAVPSAVTLSLMVHYFGVPDRFVSQGLLFGHLAGIVTMPVFLTLLFRFQGG